jgi:hypothetical protein
LAAINNSYYQTMNGKSSTDDEHVVFVPDASHLDRYLPQVNSFGTIRPFRGDDMPRVLDFESAEESPADGPLMFAEDEDTDGLMFPMYHFCLRGAFLFYFNVDDVDTESGPYVSYLNPPLGVLPLDNVSIEFPPGGRRIFREHAHSDARKGYELAVLHTPETKTNTEDTEDLEARPPAFLVAQSLGARERWAAALRDRAQRNQPTLLRAGYSKTTQSQAIGNAMSVSALQSASENPDPSIRDSDEDDNVPSRPVKLFSASPSNATEMKAHRTSSGGKRREKNSIRQQVLDASDDKDLANAVVEFGMAGFNEKRWMDNFFERNNDYDAPTKCRQMEQWQMDMKKSLKGAVLEQYDYFVQASGEMTTMGKEVAQLKAWIETQVDAFKEMKDIDFVSALKDIGKEESTKNELGMDGLYVSVEGKFDERSTSETSSITGSRRNKEAAEGDDEDAPVIDIPDWLNDVDEEITALIRECRYNDAIEMYIKAKNEVTDLLDKHERPTAYRLRKAQLEILENLQERLKILRQRVCNRLEEILRRKNEALRQSSKRERADVHSPVSTIVSPCALKDDVLYLQMLVKIGNSQQAAEAHTTRRSLLLLDTLHENPISGAGAVDLVIYSAQLSQSFFSCLASSVEGFLDLFMSPASHQQMDRAEEASLGEGSFQSHGANKTVPSGAMASVVLWCDSELTKFASAFGGSRILSNLALSPPPLEEHPRGPRVVGQNLEEEARLHGSKDRKNAIQVAAQCIDQAFLYATQNLDSVGLPLAPRLSECIRVRLKGCEAEVADLLDERWQHLIVDWRLGPLDDHIRM